MLFQTIVGETGTLAFVALALLGGVIVVFNAGSFTAGYALGRRRG